MDPDTNLRELRKLADKLITSDHPGQDNYDAQRMAELFVALDEWLSVSGVLPKDWQTKG